MKACLLVSGHLRTFQDCLESQRKHILQNIDCDVFIHTWSHLEATTKSWHNNHMNNRKVQKTDISFIEETLNPKRLVVEDQKDFGLDRNLHGSSISLNGLKNMTYGFKQTYNMMKEYEQENSIKYNYIIKIRPDIMMKKPFDKYLLPREDQFITFFGNQVPVANQQRERKYYHNFRALDILSICTNDSAARGVYNLFDNFEKYYKKESWHHSPYLDYVIDENIDFDICLRYLYGASWEIKRGA